MASANNGIVALSVKTHKALCPLSLYINPDLTHNYSAAFLHSVHHPRINFSSPERHQTSNTHHHHPFQLPLQKKHKMPRITSSSTNKRLIITLLSILAVLAISILVLVLTLYLLIPRIHKLRAARTLAAAAKKQKEDLELQAIPGNRQSYDPATDGFAPTPTHGARAVSVVSTMGTAGADIGEMKRSPSRDTLEMVDLPVSPRGLPAPYCFVDPFRRSEESSGYDEQSEETLVGLPEGEGVLERASSEFGEFIKTPSSQVAFEGVLEAVVEQKGESLAESSGKPSGEEVWGREAVAEENGESSAESSGESLAEFSRESPGE